MPRIHAFGNYSYGYALNDSGTVVGTSIAGVENQSPARHAFRETGNGMDDLGTLDGHSDSEADGINFVGEIVGESYGGSTSRGFFYTDEFGLLELDALIDNLPANYRSITAGGRFQINDSGTICSSVRLDDFSVQAFVLTPNP